MTDIGIDSLQNLISYFVKNTYRTKEADVTCQEIMQKCMLLAEFDYEYSTIDNIRGNLCSHYPSYLIILEHEKFWSLNSSDVSTSLSKMEYENVYLRNKIRNLMTRSRFARCHSRFPVPVILYNGRYVCRSATLSASPEVFVGVGLDLFRNIPSSSTDFIQSDPIVDTDLSEDKLQGDWKNKVRYYDIELLKTLNVGTIVDFMVEKKKIKYGMAVTSSEKVDQERRYNNFNLISLPYPGCEFFKEFRDQDYRSKGLVFDWYQNYVDASICVPEDFISNQLQINWDRYTEWDLVKLTQNYLKLILRYLSDSSNGILIHCISGWDRTPLFISLLRISLWADGVIHTKLSSYQLLYYTIAYDWMLFGHDLGDRLNKGEEIFFFCFDFLKYIENDQFSVHMRYERTKRTLNNETQFETITFMTSDDESMNFELLTNSSFSPKNSSSSSIEQMSGDSDPSIVFFPECQDSQNISQTNANIGPGTFHASSNKEIDVSQEFSRLSLYANRTSPIGVPIPRNSCIRQRNDSSSSGDSWQLVTATGSICGSTNTNAPYTDLDCKSLCASCMDPRTLQGLAISKNNDEASVCVPSIIQRSERLRCIRNIFYKAYGPHGFRLKDEFGGIGQYIGNIVGMTSTRAHN